MGVPQAAELWQDGGACLILSGIYDKLNVEKNVEFVEYYNFIGARRLNIFLQLPIIDI